MAQPTDTPAESASNSNVEPFELNDPAAAPAAEAAAADTPRIGLLRRIGFGRTAATEAPVSADEPAAAQTDPQDAAPARPLADRLRQLPLAASVALALALGGLLGAGATYNLQRDTDTATLAALSGEAARDQEFAAVTKQLQDSVARLRTEVAALRTGLDSAQRSAGQQFGKLNEGLARLERNTAASAPVVTGSVTAVARQDPKADSKPEAKAELKSEPKNDAKPPVAEGWRLLDYYAGRAVIETPAGRLFDVGAGSNLPGLGRVQSIKREQGQVVLTARNGTVAGAVDPRRGPYYRHYR